MPKCDLITGAARIRDAFETVESTWKNVSDQWNDAVSRRFQQNHLEPMIPRVKSALDAMAHMSLMMDEVERDCES